MLSPVLISLVVVTALQQQAPVAIVQKTSGWCSPAIANVVGNVTVNCIGVDPRALKLLNAELSRKNLELADKIREADEWTKRYKDLESQLAQAGNDNVLSLQAEEYLHEGELEKAGAVLDQILGKEEKEVDLIAANHYNRALVFELQFRPVEALPHLAKAYQYRPEQVKYGLAYSSALYHQNDFSRAEPVLLATLETTRRMAKANPVAYQSYVATMLNNLANLYTATKRMKEAQSAVQEAVDAYRQLATGNPSAYQPEVALSLNNLAIIFRTTQQMKEAEGAFQEALEIRRQLAKANPAAYQPEVALSLNNLAIFYSETGRMREAEGVYQEALETYRQLAKVNTAAYQPYVAHVQNNLGGLYHDTDLMKEAEEAYKEALDIYRPLAQANPAAYEPQLARTLKNLAVLYRDTQRIKEAESTYQEALAIRRQLAKVNPAAYQPDVASTLNSLAILELDANNVTRARADAAEALSINRELWKANSLVMGDSLARTLLIEVDVLTKAQEPNSVRCPLAREAETVAHNPQLKRMAADKQAELCSAP